MAPTNCMHGVSLAATCPQCKNEYGEQRVVRTIELDPPKPQYTQGQDINVQHGVEIEIKENGCVAWINVDGVCALRCILRPGQLLKVTDNRHAHSGYNSVAKSNGVK